MCRLSILVATLKFGIVNILFFIFGVGCLRLPRARSHYSRVLSLFMRAALFLLTLWSFDKCLTVLEIAMKVLRHYKGTSAYFTRPLVLQDARELQNHGKSIMPAKKDFEFHYRTLTKYRNHKTKQNRNCTLSCIV